MKSIKKRHDRKLGKLRYYNVKKAMKQSNRNSINISSLRMNNNDSAQENDLKTITNLSQRKLTIDEENPLKHRLHHVFPTNKDPTIIITKPDKGHGVVIMDKRDYMHKMETLLQDQTTFKRIYDDPTISDEDRLIRLLLRLEKEGFITNEEYNMVKSIDSRPARLYGLPKLHKAKQRYPLRPVTSAIKTVGYGLGKMLTNRLSHLRTSPYGVNDSFDFLNKIKSSKNVDKRMVSFDVELPRTKQCSKYKRRIHFQTLLRTAPSDTHFTFNNNMYVQINRVEIGAPLAPVIADIFMAHLETTLMDRLIQLG
ncbi:unnamed protein product, partial [Rotaria sp. Silwood2]